MLRGLEPVLTALDPEAMVADGLTAPLHPGAERYFRDARLDRVTDGDRAGRVRSSATTVALQATARLTISMVMASDSIFPDRAMRRSPAAVPVTAPCRRSPG